MQKLDYKDPETKCLWYCCLITILILSLNAQLYVQRPNTDVVCGIENRNSPISESKLHYTTSNLDTWMKRLNILGESQINNSKFCRF